MPEACREMKADVINQCRNRENENGVIKSKAAAVAVAASGKNGAAMKCGKRAEGGKMK